jgi:hypothetical protein
MIISNDYQALDQLIKELKGSMENIKKTQHHLLLGLDKLHKAGFSDKKFSEVKGVLDNGSKDITSIIKGIEESIISLQMRSQLIKEYYALLS